MLRRSSSWGAAILVFALAHSGFPEHLPVRVYTTADGLARDSVNCIFQDSEGFLWFGTGEGLSQYNGYNFRNYGMADGLQDRDVRVIVESRDKTFWLGTGTGVIHFNPRAQTPSARFHRYAIGSGTRFDSINAIFEDRDGSVWAGTDGGLFVLGETTSHLESVPLRRDTGAGAKVKCLARGGAGRLWIGTSDGLFLRLDDGRFLRFSTANGLPDNFISALLSDGADLWVGTRSGLARAEWRDAERALQVRVTYNASSGLGNSSYVHSIARTRGGSLWIGTADTLAELPPGEASARPRLFGAASGLAQGQIQAVTEDSAGNLWIGTDSEGALRILQGGFVSYDETDGLPRENIASLALSRSGELLVAIAEQPRLAVYRLRENRFRRITAALPSSPFFPESWVPWHQVLAEDRSGQWWAASSQGLLELDPGKTAAVIRRQLRLEDGTPGEHVAHVLRDSEDNIWFSTLPSVGVFPTPGEQTGLARWNRATGKIRCFSEADGLPPTSSYGVLAIFQDSRKQIWVGLYRTGIARYRNGRFEVFGDSDGVPTGGIRFFYEDRAGHLWLASGRGGLGRIDDPAAARPHISRFSTADGLSSDEIQSITEDEFGRIYAGTGFGVDRLNPADGRILHYTRAEGLAPGEVEDSLRDNAGNLWFATHSGLSKLTPRPDAASAPLATRLASVMVDGKPEPIEYGAGHVLLHDLPPGQNSIEIAFFALSMSGAASVRYQYRLEGASGQWSTPTSQRSVVFSDLRPGAYRFLARSLGPDIAVSTAATVQFRLLPHVWQRWWFLTGAGLLAAGLLYAAYANRMAHLAEIGRIRTRIARDLHDDIGSCLSKIVILSEVAQRAVNASDEVREFTSRIAQTSREALDSVGDLVWATKAQTEHLEDLVSRMRRFSTQLFEAQGVDFQFEADGLPGRMPLGLELMRQLYLIFKEAVNNAARHSHCTAAKVSLRFAEGRLTMRVTDNGSGFQPGDGPDHHGIESLKARSKAVNGRIEWRQEAGTTVELIVPLPR